MLGKEKPRRRDKTASGAKVDKQVSQHTSPPNPLQGQAEAERFLAALAPGATRFTFQTFDDNKDRKDGSLARVIHGTLAEHWDDLQRLNAQGAGIFITVNATDFKGRTAKNVVSVRALFADLDGAPLGPVLASAPAPQIIVESSPDKWHSYWLARDIALKEFTILQKALATRFGGDPAVHDLPRVMRLPGFVHQKSATPFVTRIMRIVEAPAYTAADFNFPPPKGNGSDPTPDRLKPEGMDLSPWQRLNSAALADLAAWVPALFGDAAKQQASGGYRVSSKALGRKLEEDLSLHPDGIKDWGVADQGDPREGRRTPLDVVMEHSEHKDLGAAEDWLRAQLGLAPPEGEEDVPEQDEGSRVLILRLAAKLWGAGQRLLLGHWVFGADGEISVDAFHAKWFNTTTGANGGINELMAMTAELYPTTTVPAAPLAVINIADWDSAPVPQQDYSVPDRIPIGHVTLFSGEGAAGKSTVFLHLCVAHALGGREWLKSTPKPGPALFIDAEDGVGILHKRTWDIVQHYGGRFTDLAGKLHLVSLVGEDAVLGATRRGRVEPTARWQQLLEMAGDLKPVTIGLASSANMFAGNGIDRSQVMQFISLLNKVAMVANSGLVLIAHPSLTGIQTGTGLSGSTQWHNSVRARFYLKGYKQQEGQELTGNWREIEFLKNNYGPISSNVVVEYRNGLFLPVEGIANADAVQRAARAKDVFLILLDRFNKENRNVSANPSANYAPTRFVEEQEATKGMLTKDDLAGAMRALLAAKLIAQVPYGRADRNSYRLVINDTPGEEKL
jgi:RecA-family ATPase